MPLVTFMPDTFVEGGGLWDNKDVRFSNCRFESEWDAGGRKTVKSPAFVSDIEFLDGDEPEAETGWTVGKDYKASKDSKSAEKGVATAKGDYLTGPNLRKSSNFVILVESLINALPDDKKEEYMEKLLSGAASAWNGLEAHMIRQKVERPGLEKQKRADGKVYDDTVPVIDTILKFPWDKKAPAGAKAAATASGKATAGKTAAVDPAELDSKALMEIGRVLTEGSMTKVDLSEAVFKNIPDPKIRQKIVNLLFNNEWLSEHAEEGGYEFDEGSETLTVAG